MYEVLKTSIMPAISLWQKLETKVLNVLIT